MANIRKIEGKTGISYKITVTCGTDINGKQLRHYMTWKPTEKMSEAKMQKEVEKAALRFEQSIEEGFQFDNRQTFSEYANYVIDLKERAGAKHRTIQRYHELMERIDPAIGHIKVTSLRPKHLNTFYKNLSEDGIRKRGGRACLNIDILDLMAQNHYTRAKLAKLANVAPSTITEVCSGNPVSLKTAEAVSKAFNIKTEEMFDIDHSSVALSPKTILEYHRLIHTVLEQASKEMIVSYNAAAKATPPKAKKKEVNYFQPEDIIRIREALNGEPMKWKVITHLLLITGCRRGEIMGLRWNRVDFQNNKIKIDTTLLYSSKRGVYEDTPKTNTIRYIKLPEETMALLKQYRSHYNELRLMNGERWIDTGFVFVQDNGDRMNPDSITSWLRDFSKRHDLPHINPHAFRHTMASILINTGKDVVSVSKRLGHAKVSTTTDIYAHIIMEADADASESLADIILRSPAQNAQ